MLVQVAIQDRHVQLQPERGHGVGDRCDRSDDHALKNIQLQCNGWLVLDEQSGPLTSGMPPKTAVMPRANIRRRAVGACDPALAVLCSVCARDAGAGMEQDGATGPVAAGRQEMFPQLSDASQIQPETGKLKVFISYSRNDLRFADWLLAELQARGFEAYLDRKDIAPGEPWKERLGSLILAADTVLFVMSPDSVSSQMCAWELSETDRLSKRLVPVVWRVADANAVPHLLGRLNWIFCNTEDVVATALKAIDGALNTDVTWIREHTRLGELAIRWHERGQSSALLLRGKELEEAETWVAQRPRGAPAPTDILQALIAKSRGAAARRRNILSVTLAAGLVLACGLAGMAYWQRGVAMEQRDTALSTQSRFLADLARQEVEQGYSMNGILLALAGLSDVEAGVLRPHVPEAERAANVAIYSEREIRLLKGHDKSVVNAVFSSDGRRIVTASLDGTARVWDANLGTEIAILKGHTDKVWRAAFSPRGNRIVTTSDDDTARVWDVDSGKELVALKGAVNSVRFSPDGTRLVTAFADGTAQISDTDTWKSVATLKGHTDGIMSVSYSPDGNRILTASLDGTAREWDAKSGIEIVALKGHTDRVWRASYNSDGTRILTDATDQTARVWETASGKEVLVLNGQEHGLRSASFNPDGSRIVTTSADRTARVWETSTGREIAVLRGHSNDVMGAWFSPDGERIVTESWDSTARVWEAATGKVVAVLRGHAGFVRGASFSPDGSLVLTASDDGTARLWSLAGSKNVRILKSPARSLVVAKFSPDGSRIVVASTDGVVRILEAASGKEIASFTATKSGAPQLKFSPDGKRIVTSDLDGTVRLWTTDTGDEVASFSPAEGRPSSFSFSHDGSQVESQSLDGTTRLWDAVTGKELKTFKSESFIRATTADRRLILTEPIDGVLQVKKQGTGALVATLGPHKGALRHVAFSPDATRIVTKSDHSGIQVWETASGREISVLKDRDGTLQESPFSPDGARILTSSADYAIHVWEAETGKEVSTLSGHGDQVLSAEFSPDGRSILTLSRNDMVRVWRHDRNSGELVDHAKSILTRCLTPHQREKAFLEMEPPAWCVTGPGREAERDATKWQPKWPYHAAVWRQWLIDKRSGKNPALPRME